MGKQYKNPPLIEVACQFRFESGAPWDWTIAGRVYDKVKATYPKRQQVVVNADEEVLEGEEALEDSTRLHFVREDEGAYISVGPDFLAVHCLKSYQGWEELEPEIIKILQSYREVAEPQAFKHVALRYINVLEVEASAPLLVLNHYLTIGPALPPEAFGGAGQRIFRDWIQRIDLVFKETNSVLSVQAGTLKDMENKTPALLLDLECSAMQPKTVELEESEAWLHEAHDAIERMFEACVTDDARASFDNLLEEAPYEDSST